MISIDNAVELGIRTYLGLPERVRGSAGPTRLELRSVENSFPGLLDLLEKHGAEKVGDEALGDIEMYHRLRNTLYHDGNGVTVDSVHVDGYLQLAQVLLRSLLGLEFTDGTAAPTTALGAFIESWGKLEARLRYTADNLQAAPDSVTVRDAARVLVRHGVLTSEFLDRLKAITDARNAIVHGVGVPRNEQLAPLQWELDALLQQVPGAGC